MKSRLEIRSGWSLAVPASILVQPEADQISDLYQVLKQLAKALSMIVFGKLGSIHSWLDADQCIGEIVAC